MTTYSNLNGSCMCCEREPATVSVQLQMGDGELSPDRWAICATCAATETGVRNPRPLEVLS